jgi:hypothetical protein
MLDLPSDVIIVTTGPDFTRYRAVIGPDRVNRRVVRAPTIKSDRFRFVPIEPTTSVRPAGELTVDIETEQHP